MDEYLLPTHVHCCRRGNAFVFLNLKKDDYILVAGPAADGLRVLADPCLRKSTASNDPLGELEQGGLLTRDRAAGRPFATTDIDLATEPLLDFEMAPPPAARIADWYNFIAACSTAAANLRWRRLENTVAAVAERKSRHANGNGALDLDRARALTAVFQRLRRLFPANYVCLFDSLALIEFLARYEIFPTWVFGVKLEPWAAHCWIQQEQFAFNEGVEKAASYTPIMAV